MGKRVRSISFFLLLAGIITLSRAGLPFRDRVLYDYMMPPVLQVPPADTASTAADGKERIYIENVDVWSYDKNYKADAQLLRGNVVLRHKNGRMYCDSAYLYEADNTFEAFGNVRFTQGDTLNIYCDYLHYDGVTMLARLREHVRMEHGQNTLFTDSFDYNRVDGIGYYFDYGTIVDSLNTLSSIYGQYTTSTKKAVFNDSVKLENANFTMYSDTLHYDTNTKIATIFGPTRIVGDSGYILTTRGIYDTEQDRAYLMDRSKLYSGTRFMTGDSLYYDRKAKVAEVYRRVILRDTADKVELRGGYAEYHEETEYGLARDSAYLVEYSSQDSLYAHALVMEMTKVDSAANMIKGLGNVRLFRQDIQATSDTLRYHTGDSIMKCYGNPFIWNGATQITGDSVTMFMKEGALREAQVGENAIVAQELDRVHYNQMRGNIIKAYFSNNELDSIRTEGNAETIYYSMEKDSTLSSHIKTQSSAIFMRFIGEEIDHIKLIDQTSGKMKPVTILTYEDKFFPIFVWFTEGRPKDFFDIFRTTPKPKRPEEGDAPPPDASSQ